MFGYARTSSYSVLELAVAGEHDRAAELAELVHGPLREVVGARREPVGVHRHPVDVDRRAEQLGAAGPR